jgi:hypothetical protein
MDEFLLFVPRDVIGAFLAALFLLVHDHDVLTNTPVCGENSKAIAQPLWRLNQLRQMNLFVGLQVFVQRLAGWISKPSSQLEPRGREDEP